MDKLRDRLGLGQRGMAAQIAGLGPSLGPGSAGWLRRAGSAGLICCVGLPPEERLKCDEIADRVLAALRGDKG